MSMLAFSGEDVPSDGMADTVNVYFPGGIREYVTLLFIEPEIQSLSYPSSL